MNAPLSFLDLPDEILRLIARDANVRAPLRQANRTLFRFFIHDQIRLLGREFLCEGREHLLTSSSIRTLEIHTLLLNFFVFLPKLPLLSSIICWTVQKTRTTSLPVLPNLRKMKVRNPAAWESDRQWWVSCCPNLENVTVCSAAILPLTDHCPSLRRVHLLGSCVDARLVVDLAVGKKVQKLSVRLPTDTMLPLLLATIAGPSLLSLRISVDHRRSDVPPGFDMIPALLEQCVNLSTFFCNLRHIQPFRHLPAFGRQCLVAEVKHYLDESGTTLYALPHLLELEIPLSSLKIENLVEKYATALDTLYPSLQQLMLTRGAGTDYYPLIQPLLHLDFPQLKILHLEVRTKSSVVPFLEHFPNLVEFYSHIDEMTPAESTRRVFPNILRFRICNFVSFNIFCSYVLLFPNLVFLFGADTDASTALFVSQHCPHLRELYLRNDSMQISSGFLPNLDLPRLQLFNSVLSLETFGNTITRFTSLTHLTLEHVDTLRLSQILEMPNLQSLSVHSFLPTETEGSITSCFQAHGQRLRALDLRQEIKGSMLDVILSSCRLLTRLSVANVNVSQLFVGKFELEEFTNTEMKPGAALKKVNRLIHNKVR